MASDFTCLVPQRRTSNQVRKTRPRQPNERTNLDPIQVFHRSCLRCSTHIMTPDSTKFICDVCRKKRVE